MKYLTQLIKRKFQSSSSFLFFLSDQTEDEEKRKRKNQNKKLLRRVDWAGHPLCIRPSVVVPAKPGPLDYKSEIRSKHIKREKGERNRYLHGIVDTKVCTETFLLGKPEAAAVFHAPRPPEASNAAAVSVRVDSFRLVAQLICTPRYANRAH